MFAGVVHVSFADVEARLEGIRLPHAVALRKQLAELMSRLRPRMPSHISAKTGWRPSAGTLIPDSA